MATTCKNCATTFNGNYCNNCGQSADTHAINWHYVWHDIQHGILHVDKGLFYTIKEMYTRPGATIREFIAGKRVKHFKPIAMVFLLGTIYGLLYHYLGINLMKLGNSTATTYQAFDFEAINEWIATHYAITTLASIPLYAITTAIAFRKSRYNFIEHIVINCFIAGQKFIYQAALLPLLYFLKDSSLYSSVQTLSIFIDLIVTIWIYMQVFNTYPKTNRFFRTIFSYFFFVILFGTASLIAFVIWVKLR